MNDQNIMFGYTSPPPYGKTRKLEKYRSINFDECPIFLIETFLIKEYNLFSQNTESSHEQ